MTSGFVEDEAIAKEKHQRDDYNKASHYDTLWGRASAMKRAPERHGGDDSQTPNQGRTSKLGQHAFKVLCPEMVVGNLMNDKAVIEELTGTDFQFSPRGEYFPETRFQVVTVYGREPGHVFDVFRNCSQLY